MQDFFYKEEEKKKNLEVVWFFFGVEHCESKEGLWLQGEAAFETHSFRDAEPQPMITQNDNKIIYYLPSSQTRP